MIYGGCEQFAWALMSLQHVTNMSIVMLERATKRGVSSDIIVAPYHHRQRYLLIYLSPPSLSTIDILHRFISTLTAQILYPCHTVSLIALRSSFFSLWQLSI
jgi:hypothetical protein